MKPPAPAPSETLDLASIPVRTNPALPATGFWCHPDVLKGKLRPEEWPPAPAPTTTRSSSAHFDDGEPLSHDAPAPTTLTREKFEEALRDVIREAEHSTAAYYSGDLTTNDTSDRDALLAHDAALRARVAELERVIEEKTEEAREVRDAVLAVVLRARALAPNDPDLAWLDTCAAELRKSKAKEPKR